MQSRNTNNQAITIWRAMFLSFCVPQLMTLSWFLRGVSPKTLSLNLSQRWRQSRLNFRGFCPGPGGILHPPSGLPLGSPEMGLTTGIIKKIEIFSRIIIRPTLQQESPPVREAGVASRNTILFGGRDRSPQDSSFFSTRVAPRKKECFFSTRVAPRKKEGC